MRKLALFAGILIAGSSQIAQAVTVRVDFSGTVDSVDGAPSLGDPVAALGGSIEPGTPFSGYLVFDDGVPPSEAEPGFASYAFAPSEGEFHSEVGDFEFDAIWVDPGAPEWGIFSITLSDYEDSWSEVYWEGHVVDWPAGAELVPYTSGVGLVGGSEGEPLSSTALTDIPWSLASFPVAQMTWNFMNNDLEVVYVSGTIDSLSATVPEPGPGALVAAMLVGLVALGFRRARG